MNIILLESRGSLLYKIQRLLNADGHKVLSAFNPNDAQSHWMRREQIPVNCILLDLQVPMDGLNENQRLSAIGGTLAGWIWLHDYILAEAPEMRQKTIIYSDYTSVLRKHVPAEAYNGIMVIQKADERSEKLLMASIREISRMLSRVSAN